MREQEKAHEVELVLPPLVIHAMSHSERVIGLRCSYTSNKNVRGREEIRLYQKYILTK